MDINFVLQLVPVVFSAICATIMAIFKSRLKKREKFLEREEELREKEEKERMAETDAIREGMTAILRDRMIQMYAYCEKSKHAPIYMVENMNHMYQAYRTLGGNGAMVTLYEKFKSFPHSHSGLEDIEESHI
jgi:hypothetical protein